MKILRGVLALLAVALVVIQFIRPEKNVTKESSTSGLPGQFALPADVQRILQRSCYDYHSKNTVYPWYADVQPVGWWLNSHIQEAKRHLNFDDFNSYRPMQQYRRLQ